MAPPAAERVRGAERCPGPAGSNPPAAAAAALGGRGVGAARPAAAMVARSRRRWRAGAGSLGERRGRGSGAGGTTRSCSGAWVRAAWGGDDLPEGGRGNLRSCCQEPTPSVGPPGLYSAPRTWRMWAGSQPRAASVPWAWGGVAPRP